MKKIIISLILSIVIGGNCLAASELMVIGSNALTTTGTNALTTIGSKAVSTAGTSLLAKGVATITGVGAAPIIAFVKTVTKPLKTAAGEMTIEWKYGPVNHWTVTKYDSKTETSSKYRHNLKNSFTCLDKCGYICDKYKDSKWGYKFKDGTISTRMCIRYCTYKDHNHGNWYDKKSSHTDNGSGKCKTCSYPCIGGTHKYNAGVCSKCGYVSGQKEPSNIVPQNPTVTAAQKAAEADAAVIKISTGDENGYLIINADHNNMKRDAVKSVVILLDGNEIFSRDDSVISSLPVQNGAKIIDFGEAQVQIMDKRVAFIVKPGTELAKAIGDVSHTITIKVYDSNKLTSDKWRETTSWFNGTFTSTIIVAPENGDIGTQQPVEQKPVEQQPIQQQPVEQQPVEQKPVEPESSELFSDIMKGSELEKVVEYVVDKEIMNGVGDGTFNPDGDLTRAQLATILSRVPVKDGLSKKTARKIYTDANNFADWSSEAIMYFGAFIEDNNHFACNAKVTQKEAILALARMFRLEEKIVLTEDTKNKVKEIIKKENIKDADEELKAVLGIMLQTQIMQENNEGKVNLEKNITRGEIATLIYRFYNTKLELVEKCKKSNCTGYLNDEWKVNSKYHWKECTKGHEIEAKKEHDKNSQICSVCKYNKKTGEITKETTLIEPQMTCGICKSPSTWKTTATMHISICLKNKHILLIEGHNLDSNNKCTKCGLVDTKVYTPIFADYQDSNNWAWRNVGNMVEKKIVKGSMNEATGELTISPNAPITAEGFIALLARALGYDGEEIEDGNLYIPMDNINEYWSENEWKYLMQQLGSNAKKEMQTLLATNSISGSDEEITANYRKNITRERVAYLLGRFFESKEEFGTKSVVDSFEDWGSVNGAYKYRFEILSAYDILRGRDINGKIYASPKDNITRLEAIALIDRFYSVREAGVIY